MAFNAAAILMFFSVCAYLFFQKKQYNKPIAQIESGKILLGGNKAILTLADGSKINLNDAKTGEIAKQAQLHVTKTATGQLIYRIKSDATNPVSSNYKPSYNTIETPPGGEYQIILPDGTQVWLNAASSLKYPIPFAANERRVELKGEGYFEVSKNKAKPFRVISDQQEIEVLGTHFNINAYTDEHMVKTTLLEGSVKVFAYKGNKTGQLATILKPGEQSTLTDADLSVETVDVAGAVAWKNGYFNFNEDLGSIMRKLSRWYDIQVAYEVNLSPDLLFGGKISRSKSINSVLNIIEATGNVHFKINGRRITVMK